MNITSLFSAGALISVGLLLGRILGLIREMFLAGQLGIGEQANIAIALLIIPDFITTALIGSAASAALIPAFSNRQHSNALKLLVQATLVSAAVLLVVACGMFLGEQNILQALGFDSSSITYISLAFALALCSLPLSGATAVITAWLQFRERFMAPAFATAIFNAVIILTLCFGTANITLLAFGIMAGAFMRLGAHAIAFFNSREKLPVKVFEACELDKKLLSAYAATTANGLISILPYYIPFAIISAGGSNLAVFNYSFKLVWLPAMLLQTVVQMALLPWLVKFIKNNEKQLLRYSYGMLLQVGWIVSCCVCLAMSLTSPAIAQLCFGYNKMPAEGVEQIAHLFNIGIWAIPGMVLTCIWQQILYANSKTSAALLPSTLQALLIVPLCWFGHHVWGTAGVLAGYALDQWIPILFLARKGLQFGMIESLRPSNHYIRMIVAALVAFIPLAILFKSFTMPSVVTILMAMLIGMIILGAGLFISPPIRAWVLAQLLPKRT